MRCNESQILWKFTSCMSRAVSMLVYLKKQGGISKVTHARFAESLIDGLAGHPATGNRSDEIYVQYEMTNKGLVLETSETKKDQSILLCRPPFCPMKLLTETTKMDIPAEIMSGGVKIGVAVLLESSDNCILITRRSKSMRTFPSVWVPPGGHLEPGETLVQAGLRELEEETGIHVNENDDITTLGFWESVYPPLLEKGPPKRHHIVAYLRCQAVISSEALTATMSLRAKEVDACAWLHRRLASRMTCTSTGYAGAASSIKENETSHKLCSSEFDYVDGILMSDNGVEKGRIIPVEPLLHDHSHIERISTGTRYAIKLWLNE